MLRFKGGDKHSPTAGATVESPYNLSPVGQESPVGLVSPKLTHRKIARSPFKACSCLSGNTRCQLFEACSPPHHGCLVQVLDAPSLQDDFYLNLVDWSSQNVLAVGLGSCVYLWSASTSKARLPHLLPATLVS